MEATLLDTNFNQVAVVSHFKSFIWNDRYVEPGDFELYIPMDPSLLQMYKKGYYLWNAESEHTMIIESISIEDSFDEGDFYVVSGRSLESILGKRVVWNKKIFIRDENTGVKPNLQNGIKTLLEENAINPTMPARKIDNLIFKASTDEAVTKLTFEASYLGEDLLTVVKKLCQENDIGFKITLNENDQFVFELYAGVDRSYAQITRPYVTFSPRYNNITSTKYKDSDKALKNVALVVGETELDEDGNEITRIDYEFGSATGLDRREIFVDATSLTLEDEDGGTRTAEQYQALLRKRGIDALMENTSATKFDGQLLPNIMYTYREDYNIGDVVQVEDAYGHEGTARITEYIMSHDNSGTAAYPTFEMIEKGVYEA